MKFFSAALAASLAAALFCAPAAAQPQPQPPKIRAESLLRLNDSVSFTAFISVAEVQYSLQCSGSGFQMLYFIRPSRIYPGGKPAYSSPQEMPAGVAERYRPLPELEAACAQKPDLRVISEKRDDGLQIFVDTASITEVEGGLRRVWAGFDYPQLAYDPPYNAPFGQKRERLEFDCRRNTYRMIAGYDVDPGDKVTDGLFTPAEKMQALEGELMADYRVVQQAVCGERRDWQGKPVLLVRDKPAPAAPSAVLEVTPQVAAAINALKIPAPPKTLRGFKTTGTSTYEGKTTPLAQAFAVRPTASAGIFEVELTGEGYKSRELTFLGMMGLANIREFDVDNTRNRSVTTFLELSGDWKAMAVGSELKYKLMTTDADAMLGTRKYEREESCRVTRELRADTLHPQLVGQAKELKCQAAKDQYKIVGTSYFLVDYGFVFKEGTSPNSFMFSHEKIDQLDQ